MWKLKFRILSALFLPFFLSSLFILIHHFMFDYCYKWIGDICIFLFFYVGIFIIAFLEHMICMPFAFKPTQEWLDKKQVKNLIHYCNRPPQQEGELFVFASEENEQTWFHLSQKNNNTESRLKSFFRNHAQWLELDSYKVIIPISEIDNQNMFIRRPDLSVFIVGPLKVKAKVEKNFSWHNDHLHLIFAFRYYYIYLLNIVLNLRFVFGFWKPENSPE